MSEVYLGRGNDRRVLPLGKLLGEGAAGKVYLIPAMPGAAAKLYHGEEEAKKHEAKVEAMIAAPPDLPPAIHQGKRYPQISWPQAKLYDRAGRFIGFLMPEIDFGRSSSLVNLLQKNSRRIEKLSEYYGYRVLVARNLASVFAELHRANHHMIDMKPANLRFYPQMSWMAVVDTDGFSIMGNHGRIPADQLSDEYIAPESWKRPVSELAVDQDLFALAVIIFQLLNNGVHPYAGGSVGARGQATDLQARILDGLYPYAMKPAAGLVPSTASVHRMFRRSTRELFDEAFLPGRKRPSAEQWRDHIDELLVQLSPCAAKPGEHVHFGQGCGFCGHEARIAASGAKPRPARATPTASQRPATGANARRPARMPPSQLPATIPATRPGSRPIPMAPSHAGKIRLVVTMQPRRQRSALARHWPWLAGVLVVAGLGYSTMDIWKPLLPQPGAALAAGSPSDLEIPEAKVANFPEPRDYLILPDGGALSVPIHRGPGQGFPVLDRLSLHDTVIGHGTAKGEDGAMWVYVTRDSDGMSGFVPISSLLERKEANAAAARVAIPATNPLAKRYRSMLENSEGLERAYLSEGQKLWEEDRARCIDDIDPSSCAKSVDARRSSELDSWVDAEKMSKQPPLDFGETSNAIFASGSGNQQ